MFEYSAEVIKVVDGDTVDVIIDLGFDIFVKKRVRLYGINAPETRTRDKEVKKKGLAAKARLSELLSDNHNKITLKSVGIGKFGRCLGEIYVDGTEMFSYEPRNINKLLIAEGHAVAY